MNPQERKEFENATARPWETKYIGPAACGTQPPWQEFGMSLQNGALAITSPASRGTVIALMITQTGLPDALDIANAELAVTAVNERPQLLERVQILTDLLKGCRVALEELDNLLGRGTEPLITQAIQNIDKVIE